MTTPSDRPYIGFGLGLRREHYQAIVDTEPGVDWFEVTTENFMGDGGLPLLHLDTIRNTYPVVMHGVSLSIGSTDPIDFDYLAKLKVLIKRTEPQWVSDHLCWTGVDGVNTHDLLPLPYNEEALTHVIQRVEQVQDFLGQRILLENVSSYIDFAPAAFNEWTFLRDVARGADCRILLDINNVYVSARNHGFDPYTFLNEIPSECVWQFHLAGHSDYGSHIVDTHDQPIVDDVWALYAYACESFGQVSTMIERDDNIPPLGELLEELDYAKQIAAKAEVRDESRPRAVA